MILVDARELEQVHPHFVIGGTAWPLARRPGVLEPCTKLPLTQCTGDDCGEQHTGFVVAADPR